VIGHEARARPRWAAVRRRAGDLAHLAAEHHASALFLVGSVARGDEHEGPPEHDRDSDIDFYVPHFDVADDDLCDALVGLQLACQRMLAPYRVQVHRGHLGDGGIWDTRPEIEASMRSEAVDLMTLL
jgi:hypothetical protein